MEMNDETWHLVKETPRVWALLEELKIILNLFLKLRLIKYFSNKKNQPSSQITAFEPGEMIRVIDGPFNDFSGVVENRSRKKQSEIAVMILEDQLQ